MPICKNYIKLHQIHFLFLFPFIVLGFLQFISYVKTVDVRVFLAMLCFFRQKTFKSILIRLFAEIDKKIEIIYIKMPHNHLRLDISTLNKPFLYFKREFCRVYLENSFLKNSFLKNSFLKEKKYVLR